MAKMEPGKGKRKVNVNVHRLKRLTDHSYNWRFHVREGGLK